MSTNYSLHRDCHAVVCSSCVLTYLLPFHPFVPNQRCFLPSLLSFPFCPLFLICSVFPSLLMTFICPSRLLHSHFMITTRASLSRPHVCASNQQIQRGNQAPERQHAVTRQEVRVIGHQFPTIETTKSLGR